MAKALHVLTCKKMIRNPGGDLVEDKVVGPTGEWSIAEAGLLMLRNEAEFYYLDEKVTNLAMLPECQNES